MLRPRFHFNRRDVPLGAAIIVFCGAWVAALRLAAPFVPANSIVNGAIGLLIAVWIVWPWRRENMESADEAWTRILNDRHERETNANQKAMKLPQFRLSTLLWITLAVACWFGGMRAERWLAHRNAKAAVFHLDGFPYPLVDVRATP